MPCRPACRQSTRVPFAWAAWVLLLMPGSACGQRSGDLATVRIEVQTRLIEGQQHRGFELTGISATDRAWLTAQESGDSAARTLQVFVTGQDTPVLGLVHVAGKRIIFEPRFALAEGIPLDVVFDPVVLPNAGHYSPMRKSFDRESADDEAPRVVSVHPSSPLIPQNVLKMYIRFSRPMQRGMASGCIRFLDEQGRPVEDAWLPIPQELWDREGRQFTILFDPGRIKRGLARHEQLGLPFQPGHSYTLVVDPSWQSASGAEMPSEFRHTFTVTDPDRQQPHPGNWMIEIPDAGTRSPLRIGFGESLDASMLTHAIEVRSGDEDVTGTIGVSEHADAWTLKPDDPWQPGRYTLRIDPRLEDLAGNSLSRPFEVDADAPPPVAGPRRMTITIR